MKNFSIDDILGQDAAIHYVNAYLKDPSKIPSFLIFHGPAGVGKWSLAERFSFQLLCLNGTGCGNCESCKLFYIHQHPDYIEFPTNEKIAIGDDKDPAEFTIRWLLTKRVPYQPHTSKLRIIIFPDASHINNEAETAMLKTLEETPSHTKFIFLVDDLYKLKETIISRGVKIPFNNLDKKSIRSIAEDKGIYIDEFFGGSLDPFNAPVEVIQLSKTMVEQNIGDALSLLKLENWIKGYKADHPEWEEDFNYNEFLEMISAIMLYEFSKKNSLNASEELTEIFNFKEDLHKNIPNLENFLLSRLFNKLSGLS
jgi:DNA polymerase-3 subunit gamma/tau